MANASTTGQTADDVAKQIDEIRAEIAKLGKLVSEIGSSSASSLKDQAKEKVERLSDATEEELRALRERADLAGKKIGACVREQPVAALGIAAGLGFLAALLMRK